MCVYVHNIDFCLADPLSYAAFHFRKYLLQSALYSLVNPAPVEEEDAFLPASLRGKKLNPYHEALEQLLLLKETSEGKY